MVLRKLVIGIILGAIVVAIIWATGVVRFDRPATSQDKPIEFGIGAKPRRCIANIPIRQSCEHVDSRGSVQLGPESNDGRLQ